MTTKWLSPKFVIERSVIHSIKLDLNDVPIQQRILFKHLDELLDVLCQKFDILITCMLIFKGWYQGIPPHQSSEMVHLRPCLLPGS